MNNNFKKACLYLIVFFLGCLAMYGVVYYFPATVTENVTKLEKDVTVTDEGIADAVEKIYDAVVIVTTYEDNTAVASGTGFIYTKSNDTYYLLTNYHVIADGNKVNVTFTDKKIVETKIVGSNQYADIAVLSFESKDDYAIASIGKSTDLRVGDTSFAVGAPLDNAYSWTVTRGIISGKDRMVEVALSNSNSADYVMEAIQTDTAINAGNSGGPLCNANGEVVGITSLKLVSSGVEGMGFAIPIEKALKTAEDIISGKINETPYLGINMLNLASAYYYPQFNDNIRKGNLTSGVAITKVEEDSPADKAGLKAGDIITKIDDTDTNNIAYLRYALYNYEIGDTIKITFYRNGEAKTTNVKLKTNLATS